jgi:hypothetical protein
MFLVSPTSAYPASRTDVAASAASTVSRLLTFNPGSRPSPPDWPSPVASGAASTNSGRQAAYPAPMASSTLSSDYMEDLADLSRSVAAQYLAS